MKLAVPAAQFAFGWRAVWPAAATIPDSYPFYRSVVIETYPDLDVVHLWATDGSMMLRAIVPGSLPDPDAPTGFDPAMWDLLRHTRPAEQVIAYDWPKHVLVLAKSALQMAKDDESLMVHLTVGRKRPTGSQPALGEELEPKQAVIEVDGIKVETTAIDGSVPDWRKLEPSLDLGARVKRIGFVMNRLKRLASVPGVTDVRVKFTSSTGAAITEFTTSGGGLAPVRGLLMPTRHPDDVEVSVLRDGVGVHTTTITPAAVAAAAEADDEADPLDDLDDDDVPRDEHGTRLPDGDTMVEQFREWLDAYKDPDDDEDDNTDGSGADQVELDYQQRAAGERPDPDWTDDDGDERPTVENGGLVSSQEDLPDPDDDWDDDDRRLDDGQADMPDDNGTPDDTAPAGDLRGTLIGSTGCTSSWWDDTTGTLTVSLFFPVGDYPDTSTFTGDDAHAQASAFVTAVTGDWKSAGGISPYAQPDDDEADDDSDGIVITGQDDVGGEDLPGPDSSAGRHLHAVADPTPDDTPDVVGLTRHGAPPGPADRAALLHLRPGHPPLVLLRGQPPAQPVRQGRHPRHRPVRPPAPPARVAHHDRHPSHRPRCPTRVATPYPLPCLQARAHHPPRRSTPPHDRLHGPLRCQ